MAKKIGANERALRAQREAGVVIGGPKGSLSVEEKMRLEECERAVKRNLRSWCEAGAALVEIRDERLYRETHESFAAYCRDRWDMSRQQAYRLIDATAVVR